MPLYSTVPTIATRYTAATATARRALTVKNGDTVLQSDTNKLWEVVDSTQITTDMGWQQIGYSTGATPSTLNLLSTVALGSSTTLSNVTFQAGHRYIIEYINYNMTALTNFDGINFRNTPGTENILIRYEPTGGRPAALVCYMKALGNSNNYLASDLFVPTINTNYKVALEWGMGQFVMSINDSPIIINNANSPGVGAYYAQTVNTDPLGLNGFQLGSVTSATTANIYERTNIVNNFLLGDSMTFDLNYFNDLQAGKPKSYLWLDGGTGGWKLNDVYTHLYGVVPYFQPVAITNNVIIKIGVNDLAANALASDMLPALQQIVNIIKGYNQLWKIYLCTLTPFNNYFTNGAIQATADAQRLLYNAGMYSLTNVELVINSGNIAQLQDPMDGTYYVDHLHHTPAGYLLAANFVTASLP